MARERRETVIKFRVTDEERAQIEARVPHDETLAAWARRELQGKPRRKVLPSMAPADALAFAKAFNLLNQVAKHLNTVAVRRPIEDRDLQLASSIMADVAEALLVLVDAVKNPPASPPPTEEET